MVYNLIGIINLHIYIYYLYLLFFLDFLNIYLNILFNNYIYKINKYNIFLYIFSKVIICDNFFIVNLFF